MTTPNGSAPTLPQLPVEARRWFDGALPAGMRAAGERPATVAQAAVFAVPEERGTSISEPARRIGVTRKGRPPIL